MTINEFLEQNREEIENFQKDPSGLGALVDKLWRCQGLPVKILTVILELFRLLGYHKFVYDHISEYGELYVIDSNNNPVPFYAPSLSGLKNETEAREALIYVLNEDGLSKKYLDYILKGLDFMRFDL